jgi:uracil-DNA glycosylase family 4
MSDDPREELAAIAHSVRRYLEREQSAGHAELILHAASAKPSRAGGANGGSAGTQSASTTTAPAPRAASAAPTSASSGAQTSVAAPAMHAAQSSSASTATRAPAPPEPERDLFGQPIAPPVARMPAHGPVTFEIKLNPRDPEARRAIAAEAAPLLEDIAEEVRACRKCGLWESRNRAVPGVGTALSGIVFVGEGPGAEEDRLGEPFVGRAGQLLDRVIKAMDDARLIPGVPLNRETVFIGNVVHCRPPENRTPQPFEVEQSSPYLVRQIEAIRPRIVCCLGKTAAELLLGTKASLASLRGRVYRFHGAKLIVTYHTAAVLRNPNLKRPVWEDMQLLAREYLSD